MTKIFEIALRKYVIFDLMIQRKRLFIVLVSMNNNKFLRFFI